MNKKLALKIGINVLVIICGLGFILYPAYTDRAYRGRQQGLAQAAQKIGSKKAKPDIKALPNKAVAEIVIPKINLSAYVFEGTSADIINQGPGHYEETPMPGEPGNSAIAGHRTMHGHPFRHLDQLNNGDAITVYTKAGKFSYRVVNIKVVSPNDISVIQPSTDSVLTLTTCNPVGSARQRLVVRAELAKG